MNDVIKWEEVFIMTKLIGYQSKKLIPHKDIKLIPYHERKAKKSEVSLRNLVDDIFSDNWLRKTVMGESFKIDVEEADNKYIVYAELPGVQKDEIRVNMEDELLTISVNKKEAPEEKKKNYVHRERYLERKSRNVFLENGEADSIKAKLSQGVLTITVQKQEKPDNAINVTIE